MNAKQDEGTTALHDNTVIFLSSRANWFRAEANTNRRNALIGLSSGEISHLSADKLCDQADVYDQHAKYWAKMAKNYTPKY